MGTYPVHSYFLINKDILRHLSSLLVVSGPFQSTFTVSTAILFVKLVANKRPLHIVRFFLLLRPYSKIGIGSLQTVRNCGRNLLKCLLVPKNALLLKAQAIT